MGLFVRASESYIEIRSAFLAAFEDISQISQAEDPGFESRSCLPWEEGAKDSAQLCLWKLFRLTQPNDRETVIEG
jgi:hypothetical protein